MSAVVPTGWARSPGQAAPAVATLERLSYTYPDWGDRPPPALVGLDLEIGAGITLVAGDSGAGKSTLLRVLNGLVPHFHGGRISGRAVVAGLDVLVTPTRRLARHVGFVFQDPEIGFVRGTVAREVAFGLENLGVAPARIRRQVGEALDAVGIAGLSGRRLATLSGGERQRVALAAAIAGDPEVLVLDEPTSQLDDAGAALLAGVLDRLASSGRAVVVAEHRTGRFPGASRVVHLAGGRLGEGAGAPLPGPPGVGHAGGDPGGRDAWWLEGVSAGPGGRSVLSGVTLRGAAGEVVVLTGGNGSGKTTLLRTIAGLLDPLAGTAGRAEGRVAYLPQDPGVLLHRRSVRAEVEQTLRWSRSAGDPARMLDTLGLAGLAERDPRDLSGGQRQRAALASVLVGRPALALLDEPTRGMDAAARRGLATTVRQLAGEGASVVVATHDLDLARELGDRVLEVREGGVEPRGSERGVGGP